MKSYSSVDLIGRETRLAETNNVLSYLFEKWIEKHTEEVELTISIPHYIYRRTSNICDYVRDELELPMYNSDFLNILFADFIHKNMKRFQPQKMYEELTKYDLKFNSDKLQIFDPLNNSVYTFEDEKKVEMSFDFTFSKKNVKRAEYFLADLDEFTGKFLTVEELLSRLWVNFIQSYSDGNNLKAVEKLVSLAKKYFD